MRSMSHYNPTELATACGLILGPQGVFDLLMSFIPGGRYVHYHQLPRELPVAVSYVLDVVAEQAQRFKAKHGFTPCLFIDGVDLLAKKDAQAFIDLVDRAKYLANNDTLKIILVSSEGSILQPLQKTSSTSRKRGIVEVVDIPDETAESYLSKYMPEDVAKAVVKETGGRFVHLLQALDCYQQLPSIMDTKDTIDSIVKRLVAENVKGKIAEAMQKGDFRLKMVIR